jgi:regulator of protease activity HflC (stomatin/prohibitin superfamily)
MPLGLIAFLGVVVLVLLFQIFKVLDEYERGVIYTLGRYTGTKGPGLIILVPFVQRMQKIDMRVRTIDVPSQDVISKDNVSVKVNAVIYFRVIDPNLAINQVADFMRATSELAQTTLRSVLGKHDLDEMLSGRDKLSKDIREMLDEKTDTWGIKVSDVELKHVDIDPSMIRAIAKQAEAERERRARVISAEGERQAADQLVEAAHKLGESQNAMQLRYLSAFQDATNDKSSTIILPLPLDLLTKLGGK